MDFFESLSSFLGLFSGVLPWLGLVGLAYFVSTALGFSRGRSDGQSKAGSGDISAPGGDGADGF